MNAAEFLDAFDALHPLVRERIAKAILHEAATSDLLAEVRKRYNAVNEADTIVAFSKRILACDAEIKSDMRLPAA